MLGAHRERPDMLVPGGAEVHLPGRRPRGWHKKRGAGNPTPRAEREWCGPSAVKAVAKEGNHPAQAEQGEGAGFGDCRDHVRKRGADDQPVYANRFVLV